MTSTGLHPARRLPLQAAPERTAAASDGMVVVDSFGPRSTQFTGYGFFHPRASLRPASLIWWESLIKLKAENPDWGYARIAAEAERQLASEAAQVDACLAARDTTA